MKQPVAPTLSSHLLREASRFFLYPARARPTPIKVALPFETWDKLVRKVVERRMTFHPGPEDELACDLATPTVLEEFYCRELLKAIPAIVQRTVKLSQVTLSGISDSEFVYLREAATCYIFGLPEAAVALARAALEGCLRKKLARFQGKKAVAGQDLRDLIDDLARTKGLSREGRALADKVREAANKVLHDETAGVPDPLTVIEDARAVIMELSRR